MPTDKSAKIHQQAITRFNGIWSAVEEEREQNVADRRFYSIAGAQWEGALGDQFDNKPKIEVNKVHLSVIRIFNEWRNNRITVDFVSKDGSEGDALADVCDGLYRSDEQYSGAIEAYDNAFEEGVGGGIGAWRLTTEYEDEGDDENENQRIRIEPIYDADQSVFFDLDAKRQDKADANYCFVITTMTRDAYEAEYDDDPTSWPVDRETVAFDWATPDVVYVAEYYLVEKKPHTVHIYQAVDGSEVRYTDDDFEKNTSLADELRAIGSTKVREKKVTRKAVHKYVLSGGGILDDVGIIAGSNIPVVPYYGKRWFVDNVERSMGHVRLAKDAQRLKNIQLSELAEISASSPIQKPIFTPEQVAGHEALWAEDNINNNPYLLVNPMTDLNGQPMPAGPIGTTQPPQVSPAMAALIQLTDTDMQEVLGGQQAGEEIQANVSGKAVELVQNRLDMQTFIYLSNMKKSVQRCGEIWLSMAKEIYVEEDRKLKVVNRQGVAESVTLGAKVLNKQGAVVSEGDLTRADFDVSVSVGPSSASKRAATVRAVTGMMSITQDPETLTVLGAMALENMEGEGIKEVREWNRKKLVKMGVYEPNEEDKKAQAAAAEQAQPTPDQVYLQAEAEKSKALAAKAAADTELSVAKTKNTEADTVETLAGIERDDRQQAIDLAKELDLEEAQRQPAPPNIGVSNGNPPSLIG